MIETYLKPIFSVTMLAKFTLLICYAITLDVLYVKLKQMLSRNFFEYRYNLFVLVLNEFFYGVFLFPDFVVRLLI